jgi:hypothetical protein
MAPLAYSGARGKLIYEKKLNNLSIHTNESYYTQKVHLLFLNYAHAIITFRDILKRIRNLSFCKFKEFFSV